jgi:hypothetical protein
LQWRDKGYWKVVTPQEVAHQWWGHTVGFDSGRDQWMSEGFADFSASLYLSYIDKDTKSSLPFGMTSGNCFSIAMLKASARLTSGLNHGLSR